MDAASEREKGMGFAKAQPILRATGFGFRLYPPSNKGHDANCEKRGDVEVKITGGKTVAFYGDCNHLIVLKIISPKEGKVIYDGPGAPVLAIAGKEQKMDSAERHYPK
jgi:hypothetical protein